MYQVVSFSMYYQLCSFRDVLETAKGREGVHISFFTYDADRDPKQIQQNLVLSRTSPSPPETRYITQTRAIAQTIHIRHVYKTVFQSIFNHRKSFELLHATLQQNAYTNSSCHKSLWP